MEIIPDNMRKFISDMVAEQIERVFMERFSTVSERKAFQYFGQSWVKEKDRDSRKAGKTLWMRIGGYATSAKKYYLSQLAYIWQWERENRLPFDFRNNELPEPDFKLLENDVKKAFATSSTAKTS